MVTGTLVIIFHIPVPLHICQLYIHREVFCPVFFWRGGGRVHLGVGRGELLIKRRIFLDGILGVNVILHTGFPALYGKEIP